MRPVAKVTTKQEKKELKKIARKYFWKRDKKATEVKVGYTMGGICLCLAPFDPTGMIFLGVSAYFIGMGGALNAAIFFENRTKTTCTNDAGQNLYGPEWAQDFNRAVQEQLYELATKLENNPDDAETKQTQQKLLEQVQDLQKLLTVVDDDGQAIPGEPVTFLLQKAKEEVKTIEVKKKVTPAVALDINTGNALPAPKKKIGPLDV